MNILRHNFWTWDWNRFKGQPQIKVPLARWFTRTMKHHSLSRLLSRGAPHDAIIVIYNIPNRDCGQYSKGGMPDYAAYLDYIRDVADEIGDHSPILIFEPDILAHSGTDATPELISTIKEALFLLCETSAKVYVDIGHSAWLNAHVAGKILDSVHNDRIRGFSLNVSNFETTNDNLDYGGHICSISKYNAYVIDTSRNGNGPHPTKEWCNPPGRSFGEEPMLTPTHGHCDAYLWIKVPGESDGRLNGPGAGRAHISYLKDLH